MDPAPFLDMTVSGHDLLMVYDYSRMERVNITTLAAGSYTHYHLLAWSMGVWAAAFSLAGQAKHFATATAINGTLAPIDARLGIDPQAFADMIGNFSAPVLDAFYASMFTDPGEAERFFRSRPQRSENNILHELVALRKYYTDLRPVDNIFNRRIVGSRDRIFPARNQVRSWGRNNCSIHRIAHFPFYGWPNWDHIIAADTGTP